MPEKKIPLGEFVFDSLDSRGVVVRVFLNPHEAASSPQASDSRCSASHVGVEHHGTGRHLRLLHTPRHQGDGLLRRVEVVADFAVTAEAVPIQAVDRRAVSGFATPRHFAVTSGVSLAGQSLDSIASEAERIRDIEGRVDLIIVDYIQIVRGTRNKGDSREQEVASISGGLKQLAKKMQCPVFAGSQENDDGKTRESRAIEQDADVWMKIVDGGILLKKVRNGKRDVTIPLALDGASQRFRYFRPE